jgi:hypothetical protein
MRVAGAAHPTMGRASANGAMIAITLFKAASGSAGRIIASGPDA